jgi:hypothetical protein
MVTIRRLLMDDLLQLLIPVAESGDFTGRPVTRFVGCFVGKPEIGRSGPGAAPSPGQWLLPRPNDVLLSNRRSGHSCLNRKKSAVSDGVKPIS